MRPLGVGATAGGGERQDQGPLGGGVASGSGEGQGLGPQGERAASGRGGGQDRTGQDQGRRGHIQLSEHAQKDRGEIRVGKGRGNKGKSKKKGF